MRGALLFVFSALLALPALAAAETPGLSEFLADLRESARAEKAVTWISTPFGVCPPALRCHANTRMIPFSGRAWRVVGDKLHEQTPTAVVYPADFDRARGNAADFRVVYSELPLQQIPSYNGFWITPAHAVLRETDQHTLLSVEARGERRWLLDYEVTFPKSDTPSYQYQVVFEGSERPALEPPRGAIPAQMSAHVPSFTSPLDMLDLVFDRLSPFLHERFPIQWPQNAALPRKWYFEKSLPPTFIGELKASLRQWGEALPTVPWEKSGIPVERMDPAVCLTEGAVCFGTLSENTKVCGTTPCTVDCTGTAAADPRNGLVLGGVVDCVVRPLGTVLSAIATTPLAELETGDPAELARIDARVAAGEVRLSTDDRFKALRRLYRWVVLHEVGHVLGLRHNFAASRAATVETGVRSVMDYYPGSLVFDPRFGQLGDWDIAAIRNYYGGDALPADYLSCDDEQVGRVRGCERGDYGAAGQAAVE